jgi:alginate O-acetyltransferase complex protein AlgI
MLFNSLTFALFLPIVFLCYWFVFNKSLNIQNFFLLLVSYLFYGWWDWRFLFLLFFSSSLDYLVGRQLGIITDVRRRKLLFLVSCLINISFLGFFKYYNFFTESFVAAFAGIGIKLHPATLKIILPVGISFYTFQSLGYIIDVYKHKLKPSRHFISFLAFVSFFPQLVAGPIERAENLLSQFQKKRSFDEALARDGLRQMLWGFFKKMVIADNCAFYVDQIFSNYQQQSGAMLVAGGFLFAFQIYGDFSGYSDIAIGCARLFGFSLKRNFAYPYFSRDPVEFWRRWHISLSSWFRDYVYIPLGGSRVGKAITIRNVMIVFLISGLWHGANWTFITWGLLHGLAFVVISFGFNKKGKEVIATGKQLLPGFKELLQMLLTFTFITFCWIFFRAPSVSVAIDYIQRMISHPPGSLGIHYILYFFIFLMLAVEWLQRDHPHGLYLSHIPRIRMARWAMYALLILIIFFCSPPQQTFIYFQF